MSQSHWGRIRSIQPGGFGRRRILLEIHDGGQPPLELWVTTRIPKGLEPRIGDDVYCAPVRGTYAGVERPYRIHWGRPPQYGAATVDLGVRAQKVYIGHLPTLR